MKTKDLLLLQLCHFWDQRIRFSEKHRISYLLPKKRELLFCCMIIGVHGVRFSLKIYDLSDI